jgi:hypothetical protein
MPCGRPLPRELLRELCRETSGSSRRDCLYSPGVSKRPPTSRTSVAFVLVRPRHGSMQAVSPGRCEIVGPGHLSRECARRRRVSWRCWTRGRGAFTRELPSKVSASTGSRSSGTSPTASVVRLPTLPSARRRVPGASVIFYVTSSVGFGRGDARASFSNALRIGIATRVAAPESATL